MYLRVSRLAAHTNPSEVIALSKRKPENVSYKREHNMLFASNAFGRIVYIDSTLFETTRALLEHKHHPNNLVAVSYSFNPTNEKKTYNSIQIYPKKINDCIGEILEQPVHSSYIDSHNSLHESKASIGKTITSLLKQPIDHQIIAMTTAYVPRNVHKNNRIEDVVQNNFAWLQNRFEENGWNIISHYIRHYPGTTNTRMIFQMFRLRRYEEDPSNQMSWQPTQ